MQFTHFYKISDLFVKIIKSLNLSPLSIFSFDPIDPNISNNILFKTIEINSKFDRTILDSYSKVPHVEASGEFSMIGDTYIIFIKDTEIILRIELFGESVEKISILDSLTLRKNINISKAYIAYFTEFNETNSNYLIFYNT